MLWHKIMLLVQFFQAQSPRGVFYLQFFSCASGFLVGNIGIVRQASTLSSLYRDLLVGGIVEKSLLTSVSCSNAFITGLNQIHRILLL